MDLARQTLDTTKKLISGINAIEGITILVHFFAHPVLLTFGMQGDPQFTAFAFASSDPAIDILAVADVIETKGWKMERQQVARIFFWLGGGLLSFGNFSGHSHFLTLLFCISCRLLCTAPSTRIILPGHKLFLKISERQSQLSEPTSDAFILAVLSNLPTQKIGQRRNGRNVRDGGESAPFFF